MGVMVYSLLWVINAGFMSSTVVFFVSQFWGKATSWCRGKGVSGDPENSSCDAGPSDTAESKEASSML